MVWSPWFCAEYPPGLYTSNNRTHRSSGTALPTHSSHFFHTRTEKNWQHKILPIPISALPAAISERRIHGITHILDVSLCLSDRNLKMLRQKSGIRRSVSDYLIMKPRNSLIIWNNLTSRYSFQLLFWISYQYTLSQQPSAQIPSLGGMRMPCLIRSFFTCYTNGIPANALENHHSPSRCFGTAFLTNAAIRPATSCASSSKYPLESLSLTSYSEKWFSCEKI